MATISSSGIGSGLDVNSIISQLMTVEKQPLTLLDTKEASFQAKLTSYGTLKSAVAAVQTAALALKSSTLYNSMSASVSNTAVFTASANTAAQAGSYSLKVIAKAQAASISSKDLLGTDGKPLAISDDISTVDGKLKIELGTFTPAAGTSPSSFATNPAKTPVTIDIAAGTSSLSDIRDAINAANAGVKASLIYVGTAGYRLTITSNDTGAANSIKLTTQDSSGIDLTDNTGLARLSFDPTKTAGLGKEFSVNTIAQDASFTIDGLGLTRSTNTISDAITGVTLSIGNLLATETTLTVKKDTTSASSAIDAFVTAYNELNTQLNTATAYNSTTQVASVLTGDSGARSLQSALREMIGQARKSVGSSYSTLSDLGVSLQRDGSLTFTASKFAAAMASSTTNVGDLLSSTSTVSPGLAVRMNKTLESILSSTGILASRTEGINRSVTDIASQRTRLNARLVTIEAAYRKQYSALDTLIASMQQTSAYLTQQLASLASTTKSA